VRLAAENAAPVTEQDIADICASFQAAVCDVIAAKSRAALAQFASRLPDAVPRLVVAGGVAANTSIATALISGTNAAGADLIIPPPALCTDNGVMVAWAGAERHALGVSDGFAVEARARWPLDDPGMRPQAISGAHS
jgi:N6-L-threonylcarbamoyladenine synthase